MRTSGRFRPYPWKPVRKSSAVQLCPLPLFFASPMSKTRAQLTVRPTVFPGKIVDTAFRFIASQASQILRGVSGPHAPVRPASRGTALRPFSLSSLRGDPWSRLPSFWCGLQDILRVALLRRLGPFTTSPRSGGTSCRTTTSPSRPHPTCSR